MNKETIIEKDYDDWTDDEIEFMSTQTGHCNECGHVITDDDYIIESESRGEFWGQECSENIVTGHICSQCGD